MELWKLNASIYRDTNLTVEHLKPAQDFTVYGFNPKMTVHELAVKHFLLLHRER